MSGELETTIYAEICIPIPGSRMVVMLCVPLDQLGSPEVAKDAQDQVQAVREALQGPRYATEEDARAGTNPIVPIRGIATSLGNATAINPVWCVAPFIAKVMRTPERRCEPCPPQFLTGMTVAK